MAKTQPKKAIDIKMRGDVDIRDGLVDLCKFLKKNNVTSVIEVGSFSGESSSIFSDYFEKVVCVDMWKRFYNSTEPLAKMDIFDEAEKLFDLVMHDHKNIQKIKMSSEEASSLFEDKSLQFVYLDASHKKEDFTLDLIKWVPKIMPGFYIGGHDYGNSYYEFTEVKPVVDLYFDLREIITFKDTSWVVKL